jgi:hypothetical protein
MFPTLHTSHITLFLGVPAVRVATECDQAHQSIRSFFWNRDINSYGEKVAPPQRLGSRHLNRLFWGAQFL